MRMIRVCASPLARALRPACTAIEVCATTRRRWAALLPKGNGVILHVSGCAKGCARPAATSVTLTATVTGYDRIVAGRASDSPTRRGLSDGEVARFLANEGAKSFAAERQL